MEQAGAKKGKWQDEGRRTAVSKKQRKMATNSRRKAKRGKKRVAKAQAKLDTEGRCL